MRNSGNEAWYKSAEDAAKTALLARLEAGELAAVKLFFELDKQGKTCGVEGIVIAWENE